MSSSKELYELFRDGKLGELLVREFNGKIGRVDPMKDSEFMISFESEEETPDINLILRKVIEYYRELGYEVEINDKSHGNQSFDIVIHHDRGKSSWTAFVIVLTTRYPITPGGDKKFLRVTSLKIQ